MTISSSSHPQRKTNNAAGFRSARQFPWTKEEDALLGKLIDREVSEKLNRSLSAVRGRRSFLGKTAVGFPLLFGAQLHVSHFRQPSLSEASLDPESADVCSERLQHF
jgi:hypothetical protein